MSVTPRFQCYYEDLSPGEPRFGQVAVLPWDTEIFGFPVGDCKFTDVEWLLTSRAEWQTLLRAWATRTESRLISFGVGALDRKAIELLSRCGFVLVDTSIQGKLVGLQSRTLPAPRSVFRPAEASDMDAVERMAAKAFDFGRYHTDPFFSRDLADRRYVHWVRNAFKSHDASDQMFVLGKPGEIHGFFHFVTRGTTGEVRLLAAAPAGQGYGYDLFINVLHVWQWQQVDSVTSKLSGANAASLNIHAAMGFRFVNPTLTYHWHPMQTTDGPSAS